MNRRYLVQYPLICDCRKDVVGVIMMDLNQSTSISQNNSFLFEEYRKWMDNRLCVNCQHKYSYKNNSFFSSGDMFKWEFCSPCNHQDLYDEFLRLSHEFATQNEVGEEFTNLFPRSASMGIGQKVVNKTPGSDNAVGLAFNYAKLLLDYQKSNTPYVAMIQTRSLFPRADFFLNFAQELLSRKRRGFINYSDEYDEELINSWYALINQILYEANNKRCWKYRDLQRFNVFDLKVSKIPEKCQQLANVLICILSSQIATINTELDQKRYPPSIADNENVCEHALQSAIKTIEKALTGLRKLRGILYRKEFYDPPDSFDKTRLDKFSDITAIEYYVETSYVLKMRAQIRFDLFGITPRSKTYANPYEWEEER